MVSPIILNNLGEYANFGIKCACTFLALFYTIFIIKDPRNNTKAEKNSSTQNMSNCFGFLKQFVFMPLVELFKAIFKRRPYGLHILIAMQLYGYASYCLTWEERSLRYLYMLKTFEGFDAVDYSRYYSFHDD